MHISKDQQFSIHNLFAELLAFFCELEIKPFHIEHLLAYARKDDSWLIDEAGVYILENTPPPPLGRGNKYGLMGKKYHENNARTDKKEEKKERTREKKR